MDEYQNITYPGSFNNEKSLSNWKKEFCHKGHHLFDEVKKDTSHYLHCDACNLIVHIKKIEAPINQKYEK